MVLCQFLIEYLDACYYAPNEGGEPVITEEEIELAVSGAVRKTVNKFRENPYYFFTESDVQSYLYYCLYSSKLECERDSKRIFLVHKEYPTNFRYRKNDLRDPKCVSPIPLDQREGDRGNYDFVVLNPQFIQSAPSCDDIVNKNVRLLEKRVEKDLDLAKKELLFAIEFKYVVKNNKQYIEEVIADNKKLHFSKLLGAKHAMNLVFCNINSSYVADVKKAVIEVPSDIYAVFVQSYYDQNNNKITPKPVVNENAWNLLSLADRRRIGGTAMHSCVSFDVEKQVFF